MTGTEHTTSPEGAAAPTPPRVSTEMLFGARAQREPAELEIDHRGEIYRLRITRAGKLILTK